MVSVVDGSRGRNDDATLPARSEAGTRECTGKCACELPANLVPLLHVDVATTQNHRSPVSPREQLA